MAEQDEKAKLYHQLVLRVGEERLLHEMRVHGFWPWNEEIPPDPPAEVAESKSLEAEIANLQQQHSKIKNPEKALAEERKRRWEESKKRRAEAKKKRAAEAVARQANWNKQREANVVHAGAGVSAGLQQTQSNLEQLTARGLPILHTANDIAKAMNIPLRSLRWLTYHRRGATVVHYHRYKIAKKTGGVRCISAPKAALKQAQNWVQENLLAKLAVEPEAHGFVPTRSIVSNAVGHVGKALVINLDMKDFFPSITYRRVKGLFEKFGYSEHAATVLALLCTEPPRVAAEFEGKVYHVSLGQRVLPQGASTSPTITNLLCRKLDRRLAGLAKKHGFTYTRYADDLTFSGDEPKAIGKLLRSVRSILKEEGLTEHPTKTKVMRRSNRQEVTGVVVNHKPTIAREEVRKLRAILHNAAKTGLEAQNREQHPNFTEAIRGRIAYICMVDPQRGAVLKAAFEQLQT